MTDSPAAGAARDASSISHITEQADAKAESWSTSQPGYNNKKLTIKPNNFTHQQVNTPVPRKMHLQLLPRLAVLEAAAEMSVPTQSFEQHWTTRSYKESK